MKLVWSELAKAELVEIRRYSIARWGRAVAQAYLADLAEAAKQAAERPEASRALRGPWRIRRAGSHYLILHIGADRVTVARVLHVRMDIERHLPFED